MELPVIDGPQLGMFWENAVSMVVDKLIILFHA